MNCQQDLIRGLDCTLKKGPGLFRMIKYIVNILYSFIKVKNGKYSKCFYIFHEVGEFSVPIAILTQKQKASSFFLRSNDISNVLEKHLRESFGLACAPSLTTQGKGENARSAFMRSAYGDERNYASKNNTHVLIHVSSLSYMHSQSFCKPITISHTKDYSFRF